MATRIVAPGGASTPAKNVTPDDFAAIVVISPRGTIWADTPIYSDDGFAHTRQAFWHRMRTQRVHGWRNEAQAYHLKLNFYDQAGRLWQHSGPAVMDDFGTLVEVRHD